MINWAKTKISFELDSVPFNNKTMSLCVLCNDHMIQSPMRLPNGISIQSYDIELPSKITLLTGCRDANGTVVDKNNNIITNMSITINSIRLDGLPAWKYWSENLLIIECDDSDEIILGKHICANGKIDIFLNESSAFNWLVKSKLH